MEQIRARIREKRGVDYTEAANPRAGGGEAREVSRSARRAIRSAGSVQKGDAGLRAAGPAELQLRVGHAVRVAPRHHPVLPKAVSPAAEAVSVQSEPAHSRAEHPGAAEHHVRGAGGAAGVVTPRDGSAVLRADAQPGPGADADRDRGQEPEDARRIALQPARVQRTPCARARERRCVQTLGRGAPVAAIATGSGRVTVAAGCTDDATTADAIAAAAAPHKAAYRRKDPGSAAGDVGDDEARRGGGPVAGQFGSPGGSPQPAIGATDGSTEAGSETSPPLRAPDPAAASASATCTDDRSELRRARRGQHTTQLKTMDRTTTARRTRVAASPTGSESRGRRSALRHVNQRRRRASRPLYRGAPRAAWRGRGPDHLRHRLRHVAQRAAARSRAGERRVGSPFSREARTRPARVRPPAGTRLHASPLHRRRARLARR